MSSQTEPYGRCNLLALRRATRHAAHLYDRYFAVIGLRSTQFSILRELGNDRDFSINELAHELVLDPTAASRALKPLVRDGFVEVRRGRDGRTRALALTPLGREKLAAGWVQWHAATRAFEARYGSESSTALRAALGRVAAALDAPDPARD